MVVERVRLTARDAIVTAAISVLHEHPTASLQEIALKAGVGRATLHRHFSSREVLLNQISLQCMDEMETAIGAAEQDGDTSYERLVKLFAITIPMGNRYNFLQQASDDEEIRHRYAAQLKWLEGLAVSLVQDGVLDAAVPLRWVVAQIDQLIWMGWRLVESGELTASDASALAVRTLIHGVGE